MEKTRYQKSIFNKPGRSGYFSRILFFSYNKKLGGFLSGSDSKAFWRSLFVLGLVVGVCIFLFAASPRDPLNVFGNEGYEQPSIIYAQNEKGDFIPISEHYNSRSNRKIIQLKELGGKSSKVARAFIAMEDNNFFAGFWGGHLGVSPTGILRAAIKNALAGEVKEGASTITQQVARLRFLTNERSFLRKAREAVLALWIELRYSKKEIMEIYLNEVPLGRGTIGVESAARFYFDKKAAELGWGEAALLASLTSRPESFNPLRNINESRSKVRVVFQKLIENGVLNVQEAEKEYQALEENYYKNLNLSPNENAFNIRKNLHPYASELVKRYLPKKVRRKLYTGGYRIYTTIRVEHQKAAEEVFIPHLKKLNKRWKKPPYKNFDVFDEELGSVYNLTRELFNLPKFRGRLSRQERKFQREFIYELREQALLLNKLTGLRNVDIALDRHVKNTKKYINVPGAVQGSLISVRPTDYNPGQPGGFGRGEITAAVGGTEFSSRNRLLRFVQAGRQPGSSFKPIVYAAGIDYTGRHPGEKKLRPLTAATTIDDSPPQFVDQELKEYSPENYTLSYDGPLRLRRGLALSKNIVAVRTYERMKWHRINPTAEKLLGYHRRKPGRHLKKEVTVALGSQQVAPLDMVRAFGAFAAGGKEIYPHVILYITDSAGNMLHDFRPEIDARRKKSEQILLTGTAQIITSMLMDAVSRGTGRAAFISGRQVAGKTGTTNSYKDAWFVGYTPRIVAAVQIGYDQGKPLGAGGSGGGSAAPAWGRFVRLALKNEKPGRFSFKGSRAVRLAVCEQSGKRPGKLCRKTVSELFLPRTAPKEVCEDHLTPDQRDQPLDFKKGGDDILRDDL